jgi:hypothetical protein
MEYTSSRARFRGIGQTDEYSKQAPTPCGVGTCERAPPSLERGLAVAHSLRRQAPQGVAWRDIQQVRARATYMALTPLLTT